MPHPIALRRLALLLLAGLVSCSSGPAAGPADLVVYGRVWTGDSAKPWAAAVAVDGRQNRGGGGQRGDRARWRDRRPRCSPTARRWSTPGFMDGHLHFLDGGFQLASVDLRPANTPAEFVERLAAFTSDRKPGEWILGGYWDHERWPGTPLPRREWIDSVTPNNPVFLTRLDGHMALANSAALRLGQSRPRDQGHRRWRHRARPRSRASRRASSRTRRWGRSWPSSPTPRTSSATPRSSGRWRTPPRTASPPSPR